MTSDAPPPEDAEAERVRIARLLESHAPPGWEERFDTEDLIDTILGGEPIQMFVMAADIRNSTSLMKEAVRFERFAFIMDKFVTAVRRGIRGPGGWFDKFTGDGFLAYWIVRSGPEDEYDERFVQAAGNMVRSAHTLVDFFHRLVLEDFRSNSRNLPDGVGLFDGPGRRAWLPRADRRRAHGGRAPGRRRRANGDRRQRPARDHRERLPR